MRSPAQFLQHTRLIDSETSETVQPVVKPPPELPLCFLLSHVEPDGPVRLDGVKLSVTELMGLELDEAKLGAFARSAQRL